MDGVCYKQALVLKLSSPRCFTTKPPKLARKELEKRKKTRNSRPAPVPKATSRPPSGICHRPPPGIWPLRPRHRGPPTSHGRAPVWVNPMEWKRSTGHTHTHTPTENNTPDTDTHTRQEQHPKPPNEHLPQTLNNARRWRDDGACHLPRPGGWPRRSQRERYGRRPTRMG